MNFMVAVLWMSVSISVFLTAGERMCDWPRGTCTYVNDPCPPDWERCAQYDNDCSLATNHCCCRKPKSVKKKMCDWPRGACTYIHDPCPPNWERCAQYDNDCPLATNHCCCRATVPGIWSVRTPLNLCPQFSCDVDFETIGCFKDKPIKRVLPHYIYNERDPSTKTYGGRKIDWFNWNKYVPGFACRCAQKAKELGYDLFGLQSYGECWAGNTDVHDYALYGKDDFGGCIGDDFQSCGSLSRYCIGQHRHNMVYKIVDATSCPQAPFEKVECFQDNHDVNSRPLPDYLFNDLDPSIETFSGQRVDWRNWDTYLPQVACRCAMAAKARNASFFGIQAYGQCWSDDSGNINYDVNGLSTEGCVDQCTEPCKKHSKFCAGQSFANYVYKLRGVSCDIEITPVGCFRDDPDNPIMDDIFYSEKLPGNPNYGGKSLQQSKNYTADFPEFLCKCGRYAKEGRWQYFGVKELGLCVRSSSATEEFNKHGPASECYEGNVNATCKSGSQLCASLTSNATFVYQVQLG
ncbi:uncharacterized protein [Montipora capricornis]|uniref:uncharacterized protein isoform X3 n=1 Tax=Montipora capricornis TaxID=246305 RepID=UPI0035F1062E